MDDRPTYDDIERRLIDFTFTIYEDQVTFLRLLSKALDFDPSDALRFVLDDYFRSKFDFAGELINRIQEVKGGDVMVKPEDQKFVSMTEAAEMKGVHRQTIRDAIRTGKINAYQSGKIWLIDVESLEKYKPVDRKPYSKNPKTKK